MGHAAHLDWQKFLQAVSEGDTAAVTKTLKAAAAAGSAELKSLLAATDRCGRQALHRAATCGHAVLTQLLLACGAAVAADTYGYSALHDACLTSSTTVVQLLLAAGADPNAVRTPRSGLRRVPELNTGTPLHLAAACSSPAVLKLLLQAGAAVDATGPDGATGLMKAALDGRAANAQVLLQAGAAVNARDRSKQTPLGAAAVSGNSELVQMLLAAAADVNAVNRMGRTALESAIYRGHVAVVQLLLAAGAEAEPEGHVGPHPLQYVAQLAAEHNSSKYADVLASILQHNSRVPGWAAAELLVESAAAIAGWSHCPPERQTAVMQQLLLAAGQDNQAPALAGLQEYFPGRKSARLTFLEVVFAAWMEACETCVMLESRHETVQQLLVGIAPVLAHHEQEQYEEGCGSNAELQRQPG